MNDRPFLEKILNHKRLILSIAGFLSLLGVVMWATMTRQEDPRLPDFWGQVVAAFPGADAETVEHLVLEPIEDALAEVSEIKKIEATAYDEVAVLVVELRGDVTDFREAWDEVREALTKAYNDFPEGAQPPSLDDDQTGQDSIVLALTGTADLIKLLNAARKIKKELLFLPSVARVDVVADPGEQVTVDLDDRTAKRIDISLNQLAYQLRARNNIIAGGSLHLNDKTVRLRPLSEFRSIEEIKSTPVMLPSGSVVPLSDIARVHLGPKEPASSLMRFNGEMCIGLAVVPRKNINLVDFGHIVKKRIKKLSSEVEPLKIKEVTFQPERTAERLGELSKSLLLGILIVGGILIMVMGTRMGILVASVVPLVTLTSLTIFSWGGGVLHQISIAAFVLALGMLVDNAIVIAENIQYRLDLGADSKAAMLGAVKELALPLAGATATTLAAFIPLLVADGPTAEFTKSIPVIIMITLTVSYLFAVFVTPSMSQMFLKPGTKGKRNRTGNIGKRLAGFSSGHPAMVVVIALIAVSVSFASAGLVRKQFFPTSDRNQCVMDLKLYEGSHLEATDSVCRKFEQGLLARMEVKKVTALIGRSVPKFYYNINRIPFSPHLAQLIVETDDKDDLTDLLEWARVFVKENLTDVELVARKLEQGPPVGAPIEIRLLGDNLDDLSKSANMVLDVLKNTAGTTDIRHSLGPGAPTIRFLIDDAAASRYGVSRTDVSRAIYGTTRGLPAGELYIGEDPVPLLVRSSAGENSSVDDLESLAIPAPDGRLIPLAQLARQEVTWGPAAIRHWNTRRVATVSSQLQEEYTYSDVLKELEPKLKGLEIPAGVDIGFGGDAEGSGEANSSIIKSLPIGLLLLLGVLIAEFNSFRRVLIVLTTIPLASAGVIPGLILGNQPFGFMSMLGVVALIGIVVNNAIVLLEVIEEKRNKGAGIPVAIEEAVVRRIRPILLTTATTVAGLIPLAISSSTLWPPLASAMISGLLASTLLTLVVVPALYRILFR